MSQKPNQKPKKQPPWNSFAYLVELARKKESVIVYLNANTVEDQSEIKGVIIDVDSYTLAFLTTDQRELLVFKHAVRFIERVKGK